MQQRELLFGQLLLRKKTFLQKRESDQRMNFKLQVEQKPMWQLQVRLVNLATKSNILLLKTLICLFFDRSRYTTVRHRRGNRP